MEFPDVNHCTTTEDDFGFVTKDFVKPTKNDRLNFPLDMTNDMIALA